MKIQFTHMDLAYPDPTKTSLVFLAESEFERQWLKAFCRLTKNFKFEFHYPNYEPKDLNNPVATLCMCAEPGSLEAEVQELRDTIRTACDLIDRSGTTDTQRKGLDLLSEKLK